MGTWLMLGVLGLMPLGQSQDDTGQGWRAARYHMERITNNLETWNEFPRYRPVMLRRLVRERVFLPVCTELRDTFRLPRPQRAGRGPRVVPAHAGTQCR